MKSILLFHFTQLGHRMIYLRNNAKLQGGGVEAKLRMRLKGRVWYYLLRRKLLPPCLKTVRGIIVLILSGIPFKTFVVDRLQLRFVLFKPSSWDLQAEVVSSSVRRDHWSLGEYTVKFLMTKNMNNLSKNKMSRIRNYWWVQASLYLVDWIMLLARVWRHCKCSYFVCVRPVFKKN